MYLGLAALVAIVLTYMGDGTQFESLWIPLLSSSRSPFP